MRVLVTGGTGTIGSHVAADLLSRGHTVTAYARTRSDAHRALLPDLGFIAGDVTDAARTREALTGMAAVIHLAAVTAPGRRPTLDLHAVNVTGTLNVLEGAVGAGVPTVIFGSSGAASGFSFQHRRLVPQYLPLDEAHPDRPQDPYGLSKLLGELACRGYTDAHGLRTICLRINHNWILSRTSAEFVTSAGLYQGRSIEDLWQERYVKCLTAPDGEWPVPGPPRPAHLLWTYTDIRDAVSAFALALGAEHLHHEVFAINGFDTCSLAPTAELLAEHFPEVPCRAPFPDHASVVSFDKATHLLGYRPRHSWRESDFHDWFTSLGSRSVNCSPIITTAYPVR